MFRRRTPLTRAQKLREIVWPSMGLKRGAKYILRRLMRLKDPPHRIAMGLALGLAISFTPTPGLHIIQAAVLAWMLRANIAASFIGTIFGNPLTLPLMWWMAFKTGEFTFELRGFPVSEMPRHLDFSFAELTHDFLGLFVPWLFGGYLLAVISVAPCYAVFYWMVVQVRRQQKRWREEKLHRAAASLTEPHA